MTVPDYDGKCLSGHPMPKYASGCHFCGLESQVKSLQEKLDVHRRAVEALKAADLDMGIYPAAVRGWGEQDYEQRDGFKNGWNACITEYGHKTFSILCAAQKESGLAWCDRGAHDYGMDACMKCGAPVPEPEDPPVRRLTYPEAVAQGAVMASCFFGPLFVALGFGWLAMPFVAVLVVCGASRLGEW